MVVFIVIKILKRMYIASADSKNNTNISLY